MKNSIIDQIKTSLAKHIKLTLCDDLIKEYILIKHDVTTGILGRSSPGKFIETVVQIMQYLENGKYDVQPAVDNYLRNVENRATNLPDSIKLLVAKCARTVYAMRNKRGIGHKSEVDPNTLDLKCIFNNCQWILSELVRIYHPTNPDDAKQLIEAICTTPSIVVEDFGEYKTVLRKKIKPRDELCILLYSYYPNYTPVIQIRKDMKRRDPRTITGAIGFLYKDLLIDGSKETGYKLTNLGYRQTIELINKLYNE